MAGNTLGDMALQFTLRRHNVALKTEMQRLTQENTTGQVADIARAVRGDYAPLNAIETSLRRIEGYKSANTEAVLASDSMQNVLSNVGEMASGLVSGLLNVANAASSAQLTGVGIDAEAKFRSIVAALNTRAGDRSLFAGTATKGPALADADTILAALDGVVAGAATAEGVEAAVSAWFDSPSGYLAEAYRGGPELAPLAVAPDERVDLGVTAADPRMRDALKAVAMAALINRGALAGDTGGRTALAQTAAERLLQSQEGLSDLSAKIGVAQQGISAAASRNGAEATSLTMARLELLGVDPYETALALTDAEGKLEALYAVTARAAKFSLVDYL